MGILFWGIVIFCLAFLIHLVFWKIHLPKAQTKVLLRIFIFTLAAGIFIIHLLSRPEANFILFPLRKLYEYLHLCIFYISIMLAYITTYSAIEVDSPSLVIVNKIDQAGKQGLSESRLRQMLNDDLLVKPRVRDLLRGDLAVLDADKYKLTGRGLMVAKIFDFYRRLLNVGKGG